MADERVEVSVKGRVRKVRCVQLGERTIVVSEGWVDIAQVRDEAWLEGEGVTDPEACVGKIKQENLKADLFTFSQRLPSTTPRYSYPLEWDNIAAIPTSDFAYWWEHRIPQETRKNVRRASRRGVSVRDMEFADELVQRIVEINNETPVRQGRPFWHYGKSFEQVKRDYGTFCERSVYIGAYSGTELVGFVKMVYLGDTAEILQLLCKHAHYDKRPANALLARAVEMCCAKGLKYLTYGKYTYGRRNTSPLTEFKRRNGFEKVLLPRYYIPLTAKGRAALTCGLHHGLKHVLPEQLSELYRKVRSMWYQRTMLRGSNESSG